MGLCRASVIGLCLCEHMFGAAEPKVHNGLGVQNEACMDQAMGV